MTWTRGRELSRIDFADNTSVEYKYNKDGLRTYKNSSTEEVTYEWDDNKLIRETVKKKSNNKVYDIWYLYDYNDSPIGYTYSYINSNNTKSTVTIYYEKNIQGDVIGLTTMYGTEIATYTYDAWGKITSTIHNSNYDLAYNLNHITYRGYYRDDETGFYYLQSRYYDNVTMRFLNVDKMFKVDSSNDYIFKDNMFIYCNCNPINCFDPSGNMGIRIDAKNIKRNIKKYGKKFVKLTIATMAYAYLISKGYSLAYDMFEHALYGNGKALPEVIKKRLRKKIKKDKQLKSRITFILKECKKRNVYYTQDKLYKFQFTKDKDLFYSVQHITSTRMTGNRISNKTWSVYIYIYDIYNFDEFREWTSFAGISNNLGLILESVGIVKKYKWSIVNNETYSI